MLTEFIIGFIAVFILVYYQFTKQYDYWKKKGIAYITPTFPLGTSWEQFLGKSDTGSLFQKWYTVYKKQGLRYVGGFVIQQPSLMIIDLDLCKQILTKDFNHFVTRDFSPATHEFISKHLFALEGAEWKEMRTKLTPTFTSGKMKAMFSLMEKCAQQLQDHIENVVLKEGQFEVKDLMARFTTDVIATCAFGLEVNSIKDRDNEFFKTGQLIFVPSRTNFLKFLMHKNFPTLSRLLKINFFHPRVSVVLRKLIKDTVEYRKQNNVTRNDFVDLLLKVKENKTLDDHDEKDDVLSTKCFLEKVRLFGKHELSQHNNDRHDQLTLEEMTAQAFVFFAAGFETAGSTTSFCLYELAKNEEVQQRLQHEIDQVLSNHGGKLTYQALQDMTYMDQVMNETLRMYASLPFLTRVCVKKYEVPGSDLVLDEGIRVNIPIYAYHHDPDIYPDPYKFDPDRFSEENCKQRHHYSFLPFGEGPRICIGMRFGKLQVKMGLAAILSKYQLSPAPATPDNLEINPFIVFTTPKHPFSLRITKREDL